MSSEEIDLISLAALHEFGSTDGRIPKRPFIAPVKVELEPKLVAIYQKHINELFRI